MEIFKTDPETLYDEWLSYLKEPTEEECYYLRKIINDIFQIKDK